MSGWALRARSELFFLLLFLPMSPRPIWAQGLPVQTGSQIPVALWFAGAGILGVVLAYGILHNRRRTRAQRKMTEQTTKEVYSRTERERHRSRPF